MPSKLKHVAGTPAFVRDLKSAKRKHRNTRLLAEPIQAILDHDADTLRQYSDHALTGNWAGFRELHIQADWLLVYFIEGETLTLVLTRTDTHDNLYSAKLSKQVITSYKTAPKKPFGTV